MDHPLPPLGLFLQIKLKSLSLSQTHMLKLKESHPKRDRSKIPKTPPFSHNQHFSPQEANFWQKRQCKSFDKPPFPIINTSPHKRPTFDKRDNARVLTNLKLYSTIFKVSQVVADPFIALAFIFLPLWHQAPKRDQSWPFNPIASPKSSIKSKWQ
jgi:hypothetical protein